MKRVRGLAAMGLGVVAAWTTGLTTSAAANVLDTQPLRLTEVSVPPLPSNLYRTSGSIPQFSLAGENLTSVNAAIRSVVLADQRDFLSNFVGPTNVTLPNANKGVYSIDPSVGLISASTGEVSMLLPTTELHPEGRDGNGWIAVTVNGSNGKIVSMFELIGGSDVHFNAVALVVRNELVKMSRCARGGLADQVVGKLYRNRLNTLASYQDFALTTHGLVVAFPTGAVAFPTCGALRVTIPYQYLKNHMSKLGLQLVSELRMPVLSK
jgi:hypothetical protein